MELISDKFTETFHKNENLENILNKINPSGNIIKNENLELFYKFMILRINKPKIIIESKNIYTNIKNDEINLFVNNCKKLNCCGIFLSQNSGIIEKENYQIDILNKTNMIIYLHYTNYDFDKIKLAFNVIDNIYDKIFVYNKLIENDLSKNIFNEINDEYCCFIKQKDVLKSCIRDFCGKIVNQLNHLDLDKLNKYIVNSFPDNEKNYIHKCDLCKLYTSNTLKGISAHKRGCKKKMNIQKI